MIENIAKKYFDNTKVKIDIDNVLKIVLENNLSETQLDPILFDINKNLSFLEKELSENGLTLSNLLSYAINAVFISKNVVNGSANRNRITKEYQILLNLKNSINKLKEKTSETNAIDSKPKTFLNFNREILWVADEHRTHPWSVRPGGVTVVVVYLAGKVLGYDKVKRPHRYILRIFKGDKESIYTNWDNSTLYKYLSDYVESIGAAKPDSDELVILYRNGEKVDIIRKLEEYKTE